MILWFQALDKGHKRYKSCFSKWLRLSTIPNNAIMTNMQVSLYMRELVGVVESMCYALLRMSYSARGVCALESSSYTCISKEVYLKFKCIHRY